MWEKTLGLPKPLCISPQLLFFCFQIFNLHNKELTVKPVKRIRNTSHLTEESWHVFFEHIWTWWEDGKWNPAASGAHRTQLKPRRMLRSWCKECFMLREKSLACRPWPAVMDLPSEVHVHSHGRSCTEIAADDADNINILASSIFCNKFSKKWKLPQELTRFEGSLDCFQKFLPKKRRNHF